jgi:DNA-binding IclR family transcriptional regulator
MAAKTRNTFTSALALKRELERIRDRGFAIDDEEIEDGIRCVAAPVLNPANHAVAAINVSGPSSRITPNRFQLIGQTVLKAAQELSAHIGHQDGPPSTSTRKRVSSRT